MKKIFSIFAFALLLASCTDDYKDWADPQSYLPDDAISFAGFAASGVDAIELGDVEEDSVNIFTLSNATIPEGYELTNARIYVCPEDVEGAVPQIISTDLTGKASVNDLQAYLQSVFGARPVLRALKGHVYYNAVKDGLSVLLDAGEVPVNIAPAAPIIEDIYYLVGYEDWTDSNTNYPLTNGGGDVYDDPVFSVIVPATSDDIYFKVAPQSAIGDPSFWDLIICAVTEEDDDAMAGSFAVGNNGKAFKIPNNPAYAQYKISFNMLDLTYEITGLTGDADMWYMVGNCIGSAAWNNAANGIGVGLVPLYPDVDDPTMLHYVGMFPSGGQFKLIHTPGDWGEQMNYTNISSPNASLVSDEDGDNHNIGIINEGLYYITVNTVKQSITIEAYPESATTYSTITMPGTYQGWNAGANAMTAMSTMVAENHDWVAKVTFDADANTALADPEGFKFANGSWDVNWGGSGYPYGIGTQGGPNIPYKKGTYTICFNEILGAYVFIK